MSPVAGRIVTACVKGGCVSTHSAAFCEKISVKYKKMPVKQLLPAEFQHTYSPTGPNLQKVIVFDLPFRKDKMHVTTLTFDIYTTT
jgi:hypothetical protein